MNRWLRRLHDDEQGVALVESLVSSALLGIALIALVGSLSTFALASRAAEDRALAQSVARAQAAAISAAPYQASGNYGAYYEPLPAGFARSITVAWWSATNAWNGTSPGIGLEKLNLTISKGGSPLATIEFAKASR